MGVEYPGKLHQGSTYLTAPLVGRQTCMEAGAPVPRQSSGRDMRWTDSQRAAVINRSLERNEFVLYRQPILNLSDPNDRRQRSEILLRVKTSERLHRPGPFLHAAERFGLMPRIDRRVFDTMMDWMAAGDDARIEPAIFYLNISGMSIRDDRFRSHVIETLRKRRAPGQRICFELTETAAVSSLPVAARFINQVRGLGHTCALDDFGSGLSSFAYLKNLPVDYLKIDGEFVRNIAADRTDRAIVTAIAELARAMKIRTVAEFAETAPALASLREIGVDFAQGFAVGRPRPLSVRFDVAFRHDSEPVGGALPGF